MVSGVRWYGHVLRRDSGDVLRRAFDFEVVGRRGHGKPNMTWKRQVEKHIGQIVLKKKLPLTKRNGKVVFTNFQETRGESSHLR